MGALPYIDNYHPSKGWLDIDNNGDQISGSGNSGKSIFMLLILLYLCGNHIADYKQGLESKRKSGRPAESVFQPDGTLWVERTLDPIND